MDNTYISKNELSQFKGTICIYSSDFENGLGELANSNLKNILSENVVTYYESLKNEANSNLIFLNGDEFNALKIGGLIKKYEVPVVIFISDEVKINKLSECILKNCLIINKNDYSEIDFSSFVLNNLKIKEEKELLKQQELLKNEEKNQNEITEHKDENYIEESESIENKKTDNIIINNDIKFNNKINLNNVYYISGNIKIINIFNNIFNNEIKYLNLLDTKSNKFDLLIIDINYCSISAFCDWIETIDICPIILIGLSDKNIDKFIYYMNNDILKIEDINNLDEDSLKKIINNYLISYNKNIKTTQNKRIDYDPRIGIPSNIFDNENESKIRELYNKKFYKKQEKTNSTNIEYTKKILYENNKRLDKEISLNDIYEHMGLNNIAIFESKINKDIFIYKNGKVVTYKPDKYIIEYRINRLKSKGLSNDQLTLKLKELEEYDIKFQKMKLQKQEIKNS